MSEPELKIPKRKRISVVARTAADAALNALTPNAVEKVPEITLDLENAFMLYATFCGDVERTSHALGITPAQVLELAEREGWNKKLKGIIDLKKSNKPGDVERAINRALNFVDAHKYRLFIQRMIKWLYDLTPEQMNEYLTQEQGRHKDGSTFTIKRLSTRPLADLANALEKCQMMTYLALNDSIGERTRRDDKADSEASGSEIHAQIAAGLAKLRGGTPAEVLQSAQAEPVTKQ